METPVTVDKVITPVQPKPVAPAIVGKLQDDGSVLLEITTQEKDGKGNIVAWTDTEPRHVDGMRQIINQKKTQIKGMLDELKNLQAKYKVVLATVQGASDSVDTLISSVDAVINAPDA